MLIAVGSLLAVVVLSDAIRTTINLSERRGPIARSVLRVGRALTRRLPNRRRGSAGVVMTVMVVMSWTLGLWLAWTIALFDPAVTLLDTTTGQTVGGFETIYVAGYAIFTLGTGDVVAGSLAGRIVTVVAGGTGLFTVTMEVTYLVSLTSAAAHERKTARQAHAIGHDVDRIVRRSWDGGSFTAVEPLLLDLASALGALAEQQRTFPVLHDVLPSERAFALGPTLLGLSDALEIMHRSVAQEQRVGVLAYAQAVDAIDALVQGMPEDVDHGEPPAPAASAELVRDIGATFVEEPEIDERRRARRRALFALAHEEGWERSAYDAVRSNATGSG